MKNISVFFLVMLTAFKVEFARAINFPTVQEQLEELNTNWKGKNLDYPVLRKRIPLTDDVSLIQMHLTLVEQTLRAKKNG